MAVQAGRVFDLANDVLRGAALVQGTPGAAYREVGAPFRWDREGLDQGVKVDQDLWGNVLNNREAGVPCVQEGVASCDLAEEDHWDRPETGDQHQGEDSSCSEGSGGSSCYVVEAAPFDQGEDSSCSEVDPHVPVKVDLHVPAEAGLHVRVEDSSCSEAEVLALVEYSCSGEGLVQG